MSVDSVQGNAQGMDPYAYVGGNPESRTDPMGQRVQAPDGSTSWTNPDGTIYEQSPGGDPTVIGHTHSGGSRAMVGEVRHSRRHNRLGVVEETILVGLLKSQRVIRLTMRKASLVVPPLTSLDLLVELSCLQDSYSQRVNCCYNGGARYYLQVRDRGLSLPSLLGSVCWFWERLLVYWHGKQPGSL